MENWYIHKITQEQQAKMINQLKNDLENCRDKLSNTEQKESFNRNRAERAAAEISKLQVKLNNMQVQLYAKEESISSLQQELSNTIMQNQNMVAIFTST